MDSDQPPGRRAAAHATGAPSRVFVHNSGDKKPVKQGSGAMAPEPNKIGASTPIDFSGKNLTPYGG
ncbi:MAG TPA: hypothetical protein VFC15_12575, partial [Candidatus Limnocylindrales bacterium]|nr:hypothetical protein [Candidatus Limnocylindrales bacterium]